MMSKQSLIDRHADMASRQNKLDCEARNFANEHFTLKREHTEIAKYDPVGRKFYIKCGEHSDALGLQLTQEEVVRVANWFDEIHGTKFSLAKRLEQITEIIEIVDNRCAAADGRVTPTLSEMTQAEISKIYKLASRKD